MRLPAPFRAASVPTTEALLNGVTLRSDGQLADFLDRHMEQLVESLCAPGDGHAFCGGEDRDVGDALRFAAAAIASDGLARRRVEVIADNACTKWPRNVDDRT